MESLKKQSYINLGSSDMTARRLIVRVSFQEGETLWKYWKDRDSQGAFPALNTNGGMQQRIIDALLAALIEARGQLGGSLQIADVVPYGGSTAPKIDHGVPVL